MLSLMKEYLPGGLCHWVSDNVSYDEDFGPYGIHPTSNELMTKSAMWEVKRGAPVATLDNLSSNELSWLAMFCMCSCMLCQRVMNPKQNGSFMFGALPDFALCVSSLG